MQPVFAVTLEGAGIAMLFMLFGFVYLIASIGRAVGKVPGGQQAAGAVVKHFFGGS